MAGPPTPSAGPVVTRRLRRVLFVSQRQAEAMRPPRATALISITDPARGEASIGQGWAAVLRVAFDDVDPVTFPGQDEDLVALSADHVAPICAFVASHANRCRRIVVHCRHGVSRSAAVAKAIAEAVDLPFPQDYDEYNRFVFLALRRTLAYAVSRHGQP